MLSANKSLLQTIIGPVVTCQYARTWEKQGNRNRASSNLPFSREQLHKHNSETQLHYYYTLHAMVVGLFHDVSEWKACVLGAGWLRTIVRSFKKF